MVIILRSDELVGEEKRERESDVASGALVFVVVVTFMPYFALNTTGLKSLGSCDSKVET